MKKPKSILIVLLCAFILTVGILLFTGYGKKPFKNLRTSDISSAVVTLRPPDETVPVTDLEELTAYLNDIVIYKKDNSYTNYCGQSVTFTLTMTDGSELKIMEYDPCIIIDGVGYRAKYEPGYALHHYANQLLGS